MSIELRPATLDDLAIIHAIRRDAILGIPDEAGRLIMARLETEIGKRGYGYARLESSPNAAGFYSSLGYVPVGPPDDDGAVPMEKWLNETGASK
jgi:hypothetical protein